MSRRITIALIFAHYNCEGDFTALVGDSVSGVPLPSILQYRERLETDEITLVANKLSRALDHFESAEYFADIESPGSWRCIPSK